MTALLSRPMSVIMPTRGRAKQAARAVDRIVRTAHGYDLEVIVVTDGDEDTAAACDGLPSTWVLYSEEPVRALDAWNMGAKAARYDVLVLAADDVWAYHGWAGEMLEQMAEFPNGDGFVGLNDLAVNGHYHTTHYAMTRRYARQHNGGVLVCPSYKHFYIDNEANDRAKRAGLFVWAEYAIFEHRHPVWGKAVADQGYLRREKLQAEDRVTFLARKAAGFPDNYPAVL